MASAMLAVMVTTEEIGVALSKGSPAAESLPLRAARSRPGPTGALDAPRTRAAGGCLKQIVGELSHAAPDC